ncbi:MAG: autotransporter domain-containing protein [Dechloromonas sp.]|nr:autotransporter domain-containing protein [Dechloromonas sp.]
MFAQSIGGGGGNGGFAIAAGIGTSVNIAIGGGGTGGFSIAGNYGGQGLNLALGGEGGSSGIGSRVDVGIAADPIYGSIHTWGLGSHGVIAQSIGGSGAERIDNFGTISGEVDLGSGSNSFNNLSGALFNSRSIIAVGNGLPLTNAGILPPGGMGTPQVTALTGNLVQSSSGSLLLDLSLVGHNSDRLDIAGNAQLGGSIRVNPIDTGMARTGTQRSVILNASNGTNTTGLALLAPASSLVSYALTYPSANEIALTTNIDFAPTTLSPNAQRIGAHLNAIQDAGGSSSIAPYIAALFTQPDDASLNTMYEKLGPGALGSLSAQSTTSSQVFNDAMHSCRQIEGSYRFLREGECNWIRLGGARRDQERSELNPGYIQDSYTMAGGFQKEMNAYVHLGFGLSYQQSALNSIYSTVNGQRFEGGIILKHRSDATRVSLSFSAAYGNYESRRLVDIANPGVHAEGKPKLWSTSVHGRVSHDVMASDDAYVRPMLGLGVSYISRSAYKESGAGGANLHVAKEDDTLLSLHPAIEFGGERSIGNEGTLIRHYLRVGMTQLLGSANRNFTASLEGAPSGVAPFTVSTRSDKTYADLVFGVDILRKNGTSVRLEYSGQFSEHSTTNAIGIKVAMPF